MKLDVDLDKVVSIQIEIFEKINNSLFNRNYVEVNVCVSVLVFGLVLFYGISTIVGYLMPNLLLLLL